MDRKPPSDRYMLAPPDSGSAASMRLPGAESWPDVDEHRVRPETREEVVRDRSLQAVPAMAPHGDRHCELDYVIRGNVASGYISSTDLLTRFSSGSNFATDTCVRRQGVDPKTGGRWLEELAFEVVNEQSLPDITERAGELTTRGVRRVVAIFVKKAEVCEWSEQTGRWRPLDLDGMFTDPTLAQPIRVRALLDAAEADDAVARALKAKNNRVIAQLEQDSHKEGRRQGVEQGIEQGLGQAIKVACKQFEIPLGPDRQDQMRQLDAVGLDALLKRILADRRWP